MPPSVTQNRLPFRSGGRKPQALTVPTLNVYWNAARRGAIIAPAMPATAATRGDERSKAMASKRQAARTLRTICERLETWQRRHGEKHDPCKWTRQAETNLSRLLSELED